MAHACEPRCCGEAPMFTRRGQIIFQSVTPLSPPAALLPPFSHPLNHPIPPFVPADSNRSGQNGVNCVPVFFSSSFFFFPFFLSVLAASLFFAGFPDIGLREELNVWGRGNLIVWTRTLGGCSPPTGDDSIFAGDCFVNC